MTQVTRPVHLLSSSVHHHINVSILTDNVTAFVTVLTALMNTTAVSHACLHSSCFCHSAVVSQNCFITLINAVTLTRTRLQATGQKLSVIGKLLFGVWRPLLPFSVRKPIILVFKFPNFRYMSKEPRPSGSMWDRLNLYSYWVNNRPQNPPGYTYSPSGKSI